MTLYFIGKLVVERKDDPPKIQVYHASGFSFIRQPLDILRSFILYFLCSESCGMHFDTQYSSRNVLQQAWVAIVEVGMVTWKAMNSHKSIVSLVSRIVLIKPSRLNGAT
jgi:hypothetical protein